MFILFSARQGSAALQRSGTRTNIPVQQLLKAEELKNVKEDQEGKEESSSAKKPPPGAIKMPGADDLVGALNKRENEVQDESDALLAQLKAM